MCFWFTWWFAHSLSVQMHRQLFTVEVWRKDRQAGRQAACHPRSTLSPCWPTVRPWQCWKYVSMLSQYFLFTSSFFLWLNCLWLMTGLSACVLKRPACREEQKFTAGANKRTCSSAAVAVLNVVLSLSESLEDLDSLLTLQPRAAVAPVAIGNLSCRYFNYWLVIIRPLSFCLKLVTVPTC